MLKYILFVASFFVGINGLVFDNPLNVGMGMLEPSVIKFGGQYYAVSRPNTNNEYIPIYSSWDLRNWELRSHVFNNENMPVWMIGHIYYAPDIEVLSRDNYLIYFSSKDAESGNDALGVAFSQHLIGPYYALDRPLLSDGNVTKVHPTLLKAEEELYLLWSSGREIVSRRMNDDGLSFADNETTILFGADQQWEEGIVLAPFVINRNDNYYVFYSTSLSCNGTLYGIGVARSGPYEKRSDPIVVTDSVQQQPGQCSVAKYLDGETDLIFFHAYKPGEACGYQRFMYVRTLQWDNEGWPSILEELEEESDVNV